MPPILSDKATRQGAVRASEDGTYTCVFLMDPLVDAFDYGIAQLLRRAEGAAQAAEYDKLWDEAMDQPQSGYELMQSRRYAPFAKRVVEPMRH